MLFNGRLINVFHGVASMLPKIDAESRMECTITPDATIEEIDECIYYLEGGDALPVTLGVYKKVDRKVCSVLMSFPEDCYVQRQIPEDPLKTLIPLPYFPSYFVPIAKIILKRMEILNVNATGFLQPEEEKPFK